MNLQISKLDRDDAQAKRAVIHHLAPDEPYNLFILGNLNVGMPGTHLYVAQRGGRWLGVAAYYQTYRSLCPFSHEPEVVRALVRHVANRHGPIEWMNAIGFVAGPALAELAAMGITPANDPRQIFMERAIAGAESVPLGPHEASARFITEADADHVVRLLRQMRDTPEDAPITDRDRQRVLANRQRMVLQIDGQLVATAATSGIGIRAFQIIGVVTRRQQRRRGYARSVCAALMRHLAGQGARHAVIFTDVGNEPAQRCYEGLGFAVTGDYAVAQLKVGT